MFGEDFLFRTADEVNIKVRLLPTEVRQALARALEADDERDSAIYAEAAKKVKSGSWLDDVPLSTRTLRFTVDKSFDRPWHHLFLETPRAGGAIGFRIWNGDSQDGGNRWIHYRGAMDKRILEKSFVPPTRDRVDEGTYSLGLATDKGAHLILRSAGGPYSGRFGIFEGPGGEWYVSKRGSEGPVQADQFLDVVKTLHVGGATRAIIPYSMEDLAKGYRMVDVEKVQSSYRPARFVAKAEERRYTLGVVYAADELDAHGDYANATELEKAAWRFARVAKVGLMHADGTQGAGQVVENYIYRGPDWEVDGQKVKSGDWLLGVVWTPESWAAIKSGSIRGYSLQGTAAKEPGQ